MEVFCYGSDLQNDTQNLNNRSIRNLITSVIPLIHLTHKHERITKTKLNSGFFNQIFIIILYSNFLLSVDLGF
jgi:hypothetical protein